MFVISQSEKQFLIDYSFLCLDYSYRHQKTKEPLSEQVSFVKLSRIDLAPQTDKCQAFRLLVL